MIKKLEEARSSKNGNMLNNSLAKKTQSVKNNNTTNSDSETKSTSSETKPTRKKRSTSPAPPPSSSSPGGLPLNLTPRPTTRYADLGGINPILQTVRELVEYPLTHPELYTHIGVEPPRGVLLHGPPGCGKTLLANAMAGSLGCNYIKISAPEIVSGMSGESEEKIRAVFQFASDNAPAILFIDEVDAIMSKRDGSARGMEKRIVAQVRGTVSVRTWSVERVVSNAESFERGLLVERGLVFHAILTQVNANRDVRRSRRLVF